MPAGRFWQAGGPEWDVVALSVDRKSLLLGEARWPAIRVQRRHYDMACSDLLRRGIPPLEGIDQCRIVRAVFLPEAPPGGLEIDGEAPLLVTAKEVIRVLS